MHCVPEQHVILMNGGALTEGCGPGSFVFRHAIKYAHRLNDQGSTQRPSALARSCGRPACDRAGHMHDEPPIRLFFLFLLRLHSGSAPYFLPWVVTKGSCLTFLPLSLVASSSSSCLPVQTLSPGYCLVIRLPKEPYLLSTAWIRGGRHWPGIHVSLRTAHWVHLILSCPSAWFTRVCGILPLPYLSQTHLSFKTKPSFLTKDSWPPGISLPSKPRNS